jgi:uncharacterized protein YecE (DUF72 family)
MYKNKMNLINQINNPITVIDDRLFQLMKEQMNTEEQIQFINSFKIYLEYGNDNTKFIINLDDIWKWIGFSEKGKAKRLLVGKFQKDIDYKNHLPLRASGLIGSEKEIIMLTISTFKKFCIKASTKRADQICDYYLKMENILFQYTQEKLNDYKNNLVETQNTLIETQNKLNNFIEYDEELFWNENQINDYNNKNVLYIAFIGIFNNERIYKFGKSEQIYTREFKQHQKFFDIFKMRFVIECDNMSFVEKEFKKFLKSINLLKNLEIKESNLTELFTIKEKQNIDTIIHTLIKLIDDNPLPAVKLLQDKLKQKDEEIKQMKEYLKKLNLETDYNEYINEKPPIKNQEPENVIIQSNKDENKFEINNHKEIVGNKCTKKNSSSIYTGVCKRNDNNIERYKTVIHKDGIQYYLGQYDNEIKAAIAYNLKAEELYKDSAKLNIFDIDESLYNEYKNEILENWNKDRTKTSNYKGVRKSKNNINPWTSRIFRNKEFYNLGYYDSEIKAALAYNIKSLEFDPNYIDLNILDITDDIRAEYEIEIRNKWLREKTSIYNGVQKKSNGKFISQIHIDGKNEYLGVFDNEVVAAIAYNIKATEASIKYKKQFIINDISSLNIDEKTYNIYVNQINDKCKKTKSSIYNGVYLNQGKGKWMVKITIDRKLKYIGSYDNEIKAAMVYNKKAIEVYGNEYKKLNIIDIDNKLYEEYKQELNII